MYIRPELFFNENWLIVKRDFMQIQTAQSAVICPSTFVSMSYVTMTNSSRNVLQVDFSYVQQNKTFLLAIGVIFFSVIFFCNRDGECLLCGTI